MFGGETGYRIWRIEKLQSIPNESRDYYGPVACDLSILVKAGFHLRTSAEAGACKIHALTH